MSKKSELVEVTFKIPKKLLDVLENEKYFGWSKQDFFVAATQSSISIEITSMHFDKMFALQKKYDFDPGLVQFDEKKSLIYP